MRIWLAMGALAALVGCTPAPDLEITPPPLLAMDDPCSVERIERGSDQSFINGVRACAPPTADELSFACRVAASIALNPDPRPGDPPSPPLDVRAVRCALTDAEHGKAACRFEQKAEGGRWTPAEARLTRVYWTHMDELIFERGISWRVDGACAAPAG